MSITGTKLRILLAIAFLVCIAAAPANAQLCGDANNSGDLNISDLVMVVGYLCDQHPFLFDSANADCDGRAGITAGDANALVMHFFIDLEPLVCPTTGTYVYNAAPDDTVFVPRWLDVPEHVNQVSLPVRTKFASEVRSLYFVLDEDGPLANDVFAIDSVSFSYTGNPFGIRNALGDTTYLWAAEPLHSKSMQGEMELFTIFADRTIPGTGAISLEMVDRGASLKYVIVIDGDLYIPEVVYYDYLPDPPVLEVDPASLALTAYSTQPSGDTLSIAFTSTAEPVTFELSWTEPWLDVIGYTGPLTTPSTVQVTADATELLPDVYTDMISINVTTPGNTITPVTGVPVTFTVTETVERPVGDLNCDGKLSLGDLVVMVYHLFINPSPIPPCE